MGCVEVHGAAEKCLISLGVTVIRVHHGYAGQLESVGQCLFPAEGRRRQVAIHIVGEQIIGYGRIARKPQHTGRALHSKVQFEQGEGQGAIVAQDSHGLAQGRGAEKGVSQQAVGSQGVGHAKSQSQQGIVA